MPGVQGRQARRMRTHLASAGRTTFSHPFEGHKGDSGGVSGMEDLPVPRAALDAAVDAYADAIAASLLGRAELRRSEAL